MKNPNLRYVWRGILIGSLSLLAVIRVLSSGQTPGLEINSPSTYVPAPADLAVLFGAYADLELEFRTDGRPIEVTNIVTDNPEWSSVDYHFTVEDTYYPDVRFMPRSNSGVSRATFTVYTTDIPPVYTFTVYGARVAQLNPEVVPSGPLSIRWPTQLKLNPVKNELYTRGWEGNHMGQSEERWLLRLDADTLQQTAAIELPYRIRDYGVTRDGRWLYAASDVELYTVDLDSFQLVNTFRPPVVEPSNATPYRMAVFSSTLAFVGTNPYLASGGPIYQWNPQNGAWSPAPFCGPMTGGAARPDMAMSADYSTLAGICEPGASTAVTFLYSPPDKLQVWENPISLRITVSHDGDWAMARLEGNKWTGELISMHRGFTETLYIQTTDIWPFAMSFGPSEVAYAASDDVPVIMEILPTRGIQTCRIAVYSTKGQYAYITALGGLTARDNWLYAAVWTHVGGYFGDGEIIKVPIDPFDAAAPTSQVTRLPQWVGETFTVHWSGSDVGLAGLRAFDVQYKDGLDGVWKNWLKETTKTSATFIGQGGHTYFFRCRARDHAGNLEAYPEGNGDASTQVYQYALGGNVLDNRHNPVVVARVQASPEALNSAVTGVAGDFDLYFGQPGIYELQVARTAFGALPPMKNVAVTDTNASFTPMLILPPVDDVIADGGFEAAEPGAWSFSGNVTPVITTTAHTGDGAVLLGGPAPAFTGTAPLWTSAIEQKIAIPPALPGPAVLSAVYRVVAAEPATDTLRVSLGGSTQTLTFTLPLTMTGWKHQWWDVPAWSAMATTLRVELSQGGAREVPARVILDEVSLGSPATEANSVLLPITLQH